MPRTMTAVVELKLRTNDLTASRQVDEVIAAIAAVRGVAGVETKNRSERYMDLDLAVRLTARSKVELRRLYDKVSQVADTSALRLAGRGCVLGELY